MEKTRIMPDDIDWDWHVPVKFSQGWRIHGAENLLFVGGQVSADRNGDVIGAGDIETQTRNVFTNIGRVLRDGGAEWADVVKLTTYYVFNGPDEDLKDFWAKMTRVRMEFLVEPGPASTAVRVAGLAYPGLLIEVEAIAVPPA